MSRSDAAKVVSTIIAELAGVPSEMVTPEARLVDDLEIDSITRAEIFIRLRSVLGQDIAEEAFGGLVTVADVVDYLTGQAAT